MLWQNSRGPTSSIPLEAVSSRACPKNGFSDPKLTHPSASFPAFYQRTAAYHGNLVLEFSSHCAVTHVLPRHAAHHLYHRSWSGLAAISLTSTSSARAIRVRSIFNSSGRTQGNMRLTAPSFYIPVTFYLPIPCLCSFFSLLIRPCVSLTALFSDAKIYDELLFSLLCTICRSSTGLAPSLADRTFILGLRCAVSRLSSIRVLLVSA